MKATEMLRDMAVHGLPAGPNTLLWCANEIDRLNNALDSIEDLAKRAIERKDTDEKSPHPHSG